MELAGAQTAHLGAVELGQLGEHHRVDGHVDAHAERVGTTDDREQPLLGEAFHEQAVARQHAAWCTPTPAASSRCRILPKGVVNFVPFMACLISSRWALSDTP